jgi:hypothetical protein
MAAASDDEVSPAPARPDSRSRPLSALPSVKARILSFSAILIAGVCGALIGWGAVRVGCRGNCATPEGIGAVVGSAIAATGVAVVAVLVLRAMAEWRTIAHDRAIEAASTETPPGEALAAEDAVPPEG